MEQASEMRAALLKQRVGVLRFFFLFLPLFNKHVFSVFLLDQLENGEMSWRISRVLRNKSRCACLFLLLLFQVMFFLCFLNLYKRGFNYRERRNPKLLSLMLAFADWIQGFVI
jgi:hypothetical protein